MPNGVPSHDTFCRVLEAVDPARLQVALVRWLREVRAEEGDAAGVPPVVAIDGKTMRRIFDRASGLAALHLVSAWATDTGITLGQAAVDAKYNEIAAIPPLLDLIDVKGAVVTVDAAGCQKEIAEKVARKRGDYLLELKGNQPTLHEAVVDYFLRQSERARPSRGVRRLWSTETGHGRETTREVRAAPAPKGLAGTSEWSGIATIATAVCETTDRSTGDVKGEARYCISSMPPNATRVAHAIRSHWSIENGLHWVLDVVFHEDQRRLLDRRAAENFAMLNRLAVAVLKGDARRKASIKGKRKIAGWENSYLKHLLAGNRL